MACEKEFGAHSKYIELGIAVSGVSWMSDIRERKPRPCCPEASWLPLAQCRKISGSCNQVLSSERIRQGVPELRTFSRSFSRAFFRLTGRSKANPSCVRGGCNLRFYLPGTPAPRIPGGKYLSNERKRTSDLREQRYREPVPRMRRRHF